jgi:ABC-type nitrate/sulfonate/bicarbonate transport system permease component
MTRRLAQLPPAAGLLPLAVALLAWELLATGRSPHFPPPSAWGKAIAALGANGLLMPALAATLVTLLASLAIASAFGFLLGLLIGTLTGLRNWSGMLLEYLRAIPPPVLIPVAVLMLGYSPAMKIVVIAFASIWPVLLNTSSGVAQIRGMLLDVARSLRLSWTETLVKVVVPATIPSFLLGVRVAVPHAVIITLVVEMFTGLTGIGGLMIGAQRNFNSAAVYGLLVVVGCIGLILNLLFAAMEGAILRRWPPRQQHG